MKAACVLVCFALAHGITASIFKQQERGVDGLDVQQFEYIDQYQQLHRDQPTAQKQRDQTLQSQKNRGKQLQNQKYRNKQVSEKTYQDQEQLPNQKYRKQQVSEQKYHEQEQLLNQKYHEQEQNQKYLNQHVSEQKYYDQDQLTQATQYQQDLPSYQEQYQQSASLNSQEWPSTHQHSRRSHKHHDKNHHHSSSSESSQDSNEWRNYGIQQRILRDNQKWNPVMNKDNLNSQVYGDIIEWNGLRMAVGPNSPVQTPEDIEKIFGDAQKAMRHIEKEEKVKFHEVYEITTQKAVQMV